MLYARHLYVKFLDWLAEEITNFRNEQSTFSKYHKQFIISPRTYKSLRETSRSYKEFSEAVLTILEEIR